MTLLVNMTSNFLLIVRNIINTAIFLWQKKIDIFSAKNISSFLAHMILCPLEVVEQLVDPQSELQMIVSIEDNSKIIFLISQRKHMLWPFIGTGFETVLMMGHKICFYGEKWLIFPYYLCYPFLFGALLD